jgi:hypothetical protein
MTRRKLNGSAHHFAFEAESRYRLIDPVRIIGGTRKSANSIALVVSKASHASVSARADIAERASNHDLNHRSTSQHS